MTRRFNLTLDERRKKFAAMRPAACITGKIPFLARSGARHRAKELTRTSGSVYRAYRCERCDRWHVGRSYESQTEAHRSAIVRRHYGID